MPELRETLLALYGSANQDDSLLNFLPGTEGRSLFEAGDYTYARNVRVGSSALDNGDGGTENIAGTTEVVAYRTWNGSAWVSATYPETGRFVGKLRDIANGRVFLFISDSTNGDRIEMFVKSERITYLILQFDFNFGEFVKAAIIDNWMAFTDRVNAPRLIDVDTIYQTAFTLGAQFREFHISFVKWAPTVPPIPRIYYDGSTNNWDKLSNKVFQFCFRYVYNGRLKSRWGPVSKAAYVMDSSSDLSVYYSNKQITSIEVEVRGSILDQPGAATQYNYFGHDSAKFEYAVEYIELAYREGERSPWRLWKRIKYETGSLGILEFAPRHYFDGSVDGRIIPTNEFNPQFDTVPFLAGTVEAIDNRFVFGDCLNEREPVTDFEVEDVASVTDPAEDWTDARSTLSFPQFSSTPRQKLLRLNALSQFNFKDRGIYKLGIIFGDHTGWRSLTYTTDDWIYELPDTSQYRLHGFTFNIPSSVVPPEWATCYQIVRSNVININSFMVGIANKFVPLLDNASTLIGATALPQAIKDKLAQHFENSNIVDGYQVAEELDKVRQGTSDLLTKTEGLVAKASLGLLGGSSPLNNAINNVFRGKSLSKYLDFNKLRFKIGPEIRSSNATSIAVANASRIYIDINNWYNAAQETATKNRPLSKLFYNFREGDRVRFYGSEVASPSSSDLQLYDLEILEFTGAGIIVEKPEALLSIPNGISIPWTASNYVIEIYTPNEIPDESNSIFYECGEWYPVLYPGTASRDFSKRDWRYTSNAAVTLSQYGPFDIYHKMPVFYGDCFKVSKLVSKDYEGSVTNPIFFQLSVSNSMNPNVEKTYDFWEKNNGRPSIAYLDLPQSRFVETQCRFGGKIIIDSFVNQINRFSDEDQFVYPAEYGRIRYLLNIAHAQVESVGNILLAIGESETWSIYVNRTVLEDLSGRQQVSLSNRVLGSFNTLLGSHGTLNPESVSIERGRAIFWDQNAGSWIRYAQDGLTEISVEFKMKNWFKDLSILMAPSYSGQHSRVISTWDNYHERWMTFVNDHPDNVILPASFKGYTSYKCLTFSEANIRRGWKEWLDYSADFFESLDNETYAFKDGKVFVLEDDESACGTFFGTKYDSEIELIANPEMRKMKIWQAQGHIASDKWSLPSIKGDWKSNSGTVQETSIALADLVTKEDMYWADLMRDINTPNKTGDDARINGNVMRSKALRIRLKLDPSVDYLSVFNWLALYYTTSEKTVKT